MATAEDSAVADFLQILEEHRRNCERQGKYVEAEIAKNRLEELKVRVACSITLQCYHYGVFFVLKMSRISARAIAFTIIFPTRRIIGTAALFYLPRLPQILRMWPFLGFLG